MELKDIKIILESALGAGKVAYRSFPVGKAPKLPFICYLVTSTNNFIADNKVYETITKIDIELYTKDKDIKTELKLENIFNLNSIPWNKDEDYLTDEQCYMITYEITI